MLRPSPSYAANPQFVVNLSVSTGAVKHGAASVNGGIAQKVFFRNTLGWSNFRTTVVDVALQAGNNTITFSNTSAYAPDLNKIQIASPAN